MIGIDFKFIQSTEKYLLNLKLAVMNMEKRS